MCFSEMEVTWEKALYFFQFMIAFLHKKYSYHYVKYILLLQFTVQ